MQPQNPMKRLALTLCVVCLLSACEHDPYADAFRAPVPGIDSTSLAQHVGPTKVYPVAQKDVVVATKRLERAGYVVIGYCVFNADTADYSASLYAKAKQLQADVVLSSVEAVGPVHERAAMDPASAVKDGLSNSGGYVTESGGRFATNAQSSPSMMSNAAPSSLWATVEQSNYAAVFFRKRAATATTMGK